MKAYRYRVEHAGYRIGWNRYPHRVIGAYVTIGKWCYCLKWAKA